MPIAPSNFQWSLTFAAPVGTLALDVPGPIQWTTPPIGRVAVNPCTGARTFLVRGAAGDPPPPDIPATIRIAPIDNQSTIRNALKAAWASAATGLLTTAMTGVDPQRTVVLDPSQAFEERQEDGALFVTVRLLGLP
jgi:hypothetical protein